MAWTLALPAGSELLVQLSPLSVEVKPSPGAVGSKAPSMLGLTAKQDVVVGRQATELGVPPSAIPMGVQLPPPSVDNSTERTTPTHTPALHSTFADEVLNPD